jgi:hypothetical protein
MKLGRQFGKAAHARTYHSFLSVATVIYLCSLNGCRPGQDAAYPTAPFERDSEVAIYEGVLLCDFLLKAFDVPPARDYPAI